MAERSVTGRRFGLLVVEALLGTRKGQAWCACVCDCGRRREVRVDNLKSGNTTTCGCRGDRAWQSQVPATGNANASRAMDFLDSRLPARFWNKVIPEPNSGCWLWVGALNRDGYGTFKGAGFGLSHRLAFAATALVDDSLVLDHLCRTRCCVNPAHLEQVTQGTNSARGSWAMKSTCPAGHPYDEQNTYVTREGNRKCRRCHSNRQASRNRAARKEAHVR